MTLLVLSLLALGPARAAATGEQSQSPLSDQGSSPNYRSTITSISPHAPGLSLQVLQFSDRLQLRNHTGRAVSIEGYEGEPYARIQPSGTVEVNTRSPAYYLNQSFYGNVTVPSSASASAPPHWKIVDRTGQFEWHDHRIHWMSPTLPPQVKDKGKRTLSIGMCRSRLEPRRARWRDSFTGRPSPPRRRSRRSRWARRSSCWGRCL